MTARQERWNEAAKQAAREGSEVAAALFALLAMPSPREREQERTARCSCGHPDPYHCSGE